MRTVQEFITAYENGQRLFSGLEFENGESFSGLDMSGIIFEECWFTVNFSRANLTGIKFLRCNLKTSDFSYANLTNARIIGCALEGVIFTGATIKGILVDHNSAFNLTVDLNNFSELFDVS